jgi:predicted ATPase/DNA-binding SARP family transcriptional activator
MSESGRRANLKFYLLGPPRLERDGAPVHISTRKAVALLTYLAVTRQAHSREALASLLWPEYDQARAYANLRRTLWILNQAVGKESLDVDAETASLRLEGHLWLDLAVFRDRLVECRTHGHGESEICPACLPLLTDAVELYRDDLTAGFTLPDSPGFDEWQFFESESLRRELAGALEKLVHWHAVQREFGKAISFARRWLALDTLQESTHRELMALYAWDGQWAAALRQYDECSALLKEELGAAPDAETTRLYHAIRAKQLPPQLADVAPAPPISTRQPKHNLPPQPTPFVGRQAELAEIAGLLSDPACRLLTLVGPGGAGKTRLAIESARQALTGQTSATLFRDGVYLIPLAPLSDVRYLVPTTADAVGSCFFQREGDEPRQQLLNYMREKQMLLILDTFEHLIEGAGLISDLLEQAPGVKLVVTSRERLNVRWEWVFPVEGMEFPVDGQATLESQEQYGAIQLFLQRARQASAGFAPSGTDMADIARICQLLEGLPLGIELAAAWVRILSCREIADEITRTLDFLTTSLRDVPERHRSLRAAFDHSWQLLSEGERRVLASLSVFVDEFDRHAAEHVAGANIELLSALVDKSLLVRPQSGRYGIHDVVCQFAAARLDSDPQERNAASDRHCAYYLAYLERLEQDVMGRRQVAALDEIGQEIENCRAAWQWAVEHAKWEELRRAAGTAFAFCDIRTRLHEGEEAMGSAADALELRNRPDVASQPIAEETERTLGLMLAYQGFFAFRLYRDDHAGARLQRSLVLLERWAMREELPWVRLLATANGALKLGAEAQSLLPDCLDTLRRPNPSHLLVYGYVVLSYMPSLDGRVPIQRIAQEFLAFHRSRGDRYGMAIVEFSLGEYAEGEGAMLEALQHYKESLEIRRELRDRFGLALCLDHVGFVARELGDLEQARQLHLESLDISREIGDPLGVAGSLDNLGLVAWDEGDYDEAMRCFQEGLAYRRQVGEAWAVALSLHHLGSTALRQGNYEAAAAWFLESVGNFRRLPDRSNIAMPLAGLGETCLALGHTERARRHFRAALRNLATGRIVRESVNIVAKICGLLAQTGRSERATEVLVAVLHHPASTWATRARARQLLDELVSRLPPETIPLIEARTTKVDIEQLITLLAEEL